MFTPFGLPYPKQTQPPRVPIVTDPITHLPVHKTGWFEIGIGQSGVGKLPTGNNFYNLLYKFVTTENVVVLMYGWISGYTGVGGRSTSYLEGILSPEDDEEDEEDYANTKAFIMDTYPPAWFGRTLARENALQNFAPWARTELDREAWLEMLGYQTGYDILEVLKIQVGPSTERRRKHRRRERGDQS